jgi:hypothetical protein
MLAIITIPADFIASSTAYIGSMFTDLSTLLILLIGLPLAFWVLRKVLGLARVK